jgi:hypothetical protein
MANKKLSELTERVNLPLESLIHILDPNDLSDSPQGSDFKFEINKLVETPTSLQTKRPLKTIEGQSLEGFGNVVLPNNTAIQLLSTGLNQGGLLTINTDAAKFNLSAGFGYVVNGHSDPDNTTHTKVTWTAKIANIIPNLSTQKQTYVAVDINGDLFLTNVPLTATQRRNYIRIGVLIHLNNSAVTYIDNQPTINIEIGGQVQDILEALGFKSLSGNRIFPVSNNLKIKKELGRVFKSGANFDNLTTQPHSFTLAAQEPITFRYRTQTGAEGSNITDITPAIYDLNGTITPVAATATLATIQRVYIFQDGVIRIQPGQRVFTTLNAAITALNSDVFITDLDISENGLYLGAIVLTRNTVNLSNISQAIFAPSIGTTANGSVASPALGYTAEDVANKQNSLVVDGTGAKYTTVDAVNAGLSGKANIASPALTGTPTAPTATEGTNTTQIATTAFSKANSDSSLVDAKAYADTLVVGLLDDRGNFDASGNLFPSLGGSGSGGAVLKGDLWSISVAGTLGGVAVTAGDVCRSLSDSPAQVASNWNLTENNFGYVAENLNNKKTTLTGNETSNIFYASIKAIIDYFSSSRIITILGFTPENVANKQNSLVVDGTGAKYTTVDAVNAGLNAKISGSGTTNQLAKFTASGAVGNSSIFDNGNAGIGTTTTGEKLSVNGNIVIVSNGSLKFGNVSNNNNVVGISQVNGFGLKIGVFKAGGGGVLGVDSLDALNIQQTSGNVGINQPNPTERLEVVGNGKFTGTVTASPAELETELATLGQVNSFRPYKVYTALLSQSGTNAPVATVLENTLGGVPTYQRNTQGAYQLTLSNAFINLKTALFITDSSASQLRIYRSSASVINIEMSTGDNTLLNNTIEIRVYN